MFWEKVLKEKNNITGKNNLPIKDNLLSQTYEYIRPVLNCDLCDYFDRHDALVLNRDFWDYCDRGCLEL